MVRAKNLRDEGSFGDFLFIRRAIGFAVDSQHKR